MIDAHANSHLERRNPITLTSAANPANPPPQPRSNNESSSGSFSSSASTRMTQNRQNNNGNRHTRIFGGRRLPPSPPPSPPPEELPIRIGWLRVRWYTCDTFEEAVMTLKPTNGACLLALMAMCNLGSLLFHLYAAILWLSKGDFSLDFITCTGDVVCRLSAGIILGPGGTSGNQSLTGHIIWAWLVAQIVVGGLKLCFRFHTKRQCIRFRRNPRNLGQSNAQNQEEIRNILSSITFRVHIGLGRTAQVLGLVGHLFYFYLIRNEIDKTLDPLCMYVLLDVCCANVVVAFFRVFMALYVLHFYAFQEREHALNPPAAKGGLSQVEIHQLSKVIKYTTIAKVRQKYENLEDQCPICLQEFEEDKRLVMLPCDERHIYHRSCIRTWLSKRDSCPLCQYSLRHLTFTG